MRGKQSRSALQYISYPPPKKKKKNPKSHLIIVTEHRKLVPCEPQKLLSLSEFFFTSVGITYHRQQHIFNISLNKNHILDLQAVPLFARVRERIAEYRKLNSYHSNHSDEDDSSKPCVDNVRVGGDVWMARLIKFYYTQTGDDVHKRRVYRKTQKENIYHLV